VARDFAPALVFEPADAPQQLVVLQRLRRGQVVPQAAHGLRQSEARRVRHQPADRVVGVFVFANGYFWVDHVAEFGEQLVALGLQQRQLFVDRFHLRARI